MAGHKGIFVGGLEKPIPWGTYMYVWMSRAENVCGFERNIVFSLKGAFLK